jgi:hypothetical protein
MNWTIRIVKNGRRVKAGPTCGSFVGAVRWYVANLFYHEGDVHIYRNGSWYATYHFEGTHHANA